MTSLTDYSTVPLGDLIEASAGGGLRYVVLFDSGEKLTRDAVGPFDSIEQIDELLIWPESFEFDFDESKWRRTGVYLSKPLAGTDYKSTGEILEERLAR